MKSFYTTLFKMHSTCSKCPSPMEIVEFYKELSGALFYDFSRKHFQSALEIEQYFIQLKAGFTTLLLRNEDMLSESASDLADLFFNGLPSVFKSLKSDIKAIYLGDPAAKSEREIIRSYPGFYAIMTHRIAHLMDSIGILDFPRILSEYAHHKTGIDIHPKAKIGDHFCIDHGTGVVIGETCVIGEHVKLYQGVTLGALSVDKKDANSKRHPTLEDGVVIYANSTILGGKTTIGKNSIIGGNVWLTKSVPPNTKLYYKAALYDAANDVTDIFVLKELSQK